jgi:hypothetical protein
LEVRCDCIWEPAQGTRARRGTRREARDGRPASRLSGEKRAGVSGGAASRRERAERQQPNGRPLRRSKSVAHRRGFSRQRIDFRFWPGREEDVERSASSTLSSQHTNAGMIWLSESDREMEM